MTWAALRYWVFHRGLLSGAILGGLLGSFILPLLGTIIGVMLGFLIGGAVGIGTGLTLTVCIRLGVMRHPNLVLNLLIVCVLFVELNMLFTFLLVGGTVALYGTGERISRMFQAGIIPALLSAIPAIYYTPRFTDEALQIQSYRGTIS